MRLWRASSIRSRPNWSCTATTRHATMRGSACSITWKDFTTGSDGTHRLATRPRYRSRRSNRLVRCPPFVGKIMPVLEHDGQYVQGSSAIIDYVADHLGGTKLTVVDPTERAKVLELENTLD